MYLHHLRGTCALSSDDLSLLGYQQPQIIWLGTQSCLWRALAWDIAEGSMSVLLHVAHMARLVEKVPAVVLEAFKAGHIPSAFLGQVAKSIQYWNHGERSHVSIPRCLQGSRVRQHATGHSVGQLTVSTLIVFSPLPGQSKCVRT